MFQFYTQRHLARPMGLLLLVPITTPLAAAFLHLTRPPLPPMQPVRTHADRPSVKSQPAPEKASGGGKKVGRGSRTQSAMMPPIHWMNSPHWRMLDAPELRPLRTVWGMLRCAAIASAAGWRRAGTDHQSPISCQRGLFHFSSMHLRWRACS